MLDTAHAHRAWNVSTVRSSPVPGGDSAGMMLRIQTITYTVRAQILEDWKIPNVDVIVIEAPAFSKNNGMSHERAGLWWHIYGMLTEFGCRILVVKPNVRAKYATGRGTAGKDEVMLAVPKRYPTAPITNNNECDAVVLAAMGARYAECPIETTLPAAHLSAMKTVG